MKAKLKNLVDVYGRRALLLYVALCAVNFTLVFVLLRAGLQDLLPASVLAYLPANGTTFLGAYAIYKAMQIPRIAFALVVIPVVARWIGPPPAAPVDRAGPPPAAEPAVPAESTG